MLLVVPYAPIWLYFVYYPVALAALLGLAGVSCTNPGLVPSRSKLSKEEKEGGKFIWNDRVKSWRPRGALYCTTNDVVVENYGEQKDPGSPYASSFRGSGRHEEAKKAPRAANNALPCHSSLPQTA